MKGTVYEVHDSQYSGCALLWEQDEVHHGVFRLRS